MKAEKRRKRKYVATECGSDEGEVSSSSDVERSRACRACLKDSSIEKNDSISSGKDLTIVETNPPAARFKDHVPFVSCEREDDDNSNHCASRVFCFEGRLWRWSE
mmetsp:Transcript_24278/g.41248  ORF Transcript_24278/g.41248 Transcript_24278/m.41248 type:complete len:105 (-) Transcript_24278:806-1120(-)